MILGTAGHIDHGKTALVKALTGVETDRLKEERERGITIDLGFAELRGEGARMGVVDVPGHEGFVRNMLAGATGMGVALLVVAADEGVMPQTREHLAIIRLLGVPRLLVALTKMDLVEAEWADLVEEDVREVVAATGYEEVEVHRVSSLTGAGVDGLREALLTSARAAPDPAEDLLALPVDRVFTVRGTGTVVTGTLLSGSVAVGGRVRLLPSGVEARVRGLQVHGADVERATAGSRTAVALVGDGVDREAVGRGEVLVADPGWHSTHILTVRLRVLSDTGWGVDHNQRVRVHLGTSEVMARVVLFGSESLEPGGWGWGQLRLEKPVVARGRQRGVLRSYSPVTTIAGIEVAEPAAPKRGVATEPGVAGLPTLLDGSPEAAAGVALALAGPAGVRAAELAHRLGRSPAEISRAVDALVARGAARTPAGVLIGRVVMDGVIRAFEAEVDRVHREEPYRPGVAVEALRARVPAGSAPGLADLALGRLVDGGSVVMDRGVVARPGHEPRLSPEQQEVRDDLRRRIVAGGLAPPFLSELPEEVLAGPAVPVILAGLVADGSLVALDHDLYVDAAALADAVAAIGAQLGGRSGLGPADFRDAVPVTRKHLLPILAWCDREGVTRREGAGRAVPVGGG